MTNRKTILITGAAGFIGYYLVKALHELDYCIVGIDNINDYYSTDLKYDRLADCGIERKKVAVDTPVVSSSLPNYTFQQTDITHLPVLEKLFASHSFHCVINLAAQAGVRYSLENPHAYVLSNVVGFVNLLECCRNHSIQHFMYASSSSVYGANAKVPFSEDDRVDNPVSLYAATKKSNELMAHAYSHLYQLPTTGLRFFTVYGPWGRPDMAPMLFANAISKGEAINIFNNGEMQRDFTYVADIVHGVVDLIDKIPNQTPPFRVMNIGNSQPIDLMQFIAYLESSLGKEAKKNYLPMQNGDVKITYADTTKLSELTNYKPSTPLQEGVELFVDWFKTYYKQ